MIKLDDKQVVITLDGDKEFGNLIRVFCRLLMALQKIDDLSMRRQELFILNILISNFSYSLSEKLEDSQL